MTLLAENDVDGPVDFLPFCPLCDGTYSVHVNEIPAPRLQRARIARFVEIATHSWECQVCGRAWTEVEWLYVGPAHGTA
jgi:hypothetical protein